MLKSIDATKSLSFLQNTKCAEVFWLNENSFSIVCTCCEIKSFNFNDFVAHFHNLHLPARRNIVKNEPSPMSDIESEDINSLVLNEYTGVETNTLNSNVSYLEKKEPEIEENTRDDSESGDDYEHIDPSQNGDDDEDDDDEDYVPKVLKKTEKVERSELHECEKCKKRYKNATTLKQHLQKCGSDEEKTKPIKCPRCELTFKGRRALNTHVIKEHKGYPCDQCDRVYKCRESLYTHKFNHTGKRNFVCDYENCNKSFYNAKILSNHKRLVHRTERNVICEICGYRTKSVSTLTVHVRTHTGEKPYPCPTCGKCFVSLSMLAEHKPIHSTERPHVCDVCGAAFSRPKALYHHKYLHLGVKKFVCKICGKAYAQMAGLCGHMRKHKSEQFFN